MISDEGFVSFSSMSFLQTKSHIAYQSRKPKNEALWIEMEDLMEEQRGFPGTLFLQRQHLKYFHGNFKV